MQLLSLLFNSFAAGILLLLGTGCYVIYQCFLSPLARIPGPFWAKLTNWHRAYLTYEGQAHRKYLALHRKYGAVVRTGPNVLSVADPTAFREIYKAGGKFAKSASYSVPKEIHAFDLFRQRNEKIHGEQRKLVARAYSMDSMVHLEPNVSSLLTSMVQKLDTLSGVVDLGVFLQLFAFDVIGAVSFSRPFGYVTAGDDDGVFSRLKQSLRSMSWLMNVPWFYDLHQVLKPYIGNWLAVNDRNGYFYQFAAQEIVSRKDRGGDDRDIVNQLFAIQKTKPHFSDTDMAYMLTANVFAGSDTTATSLNAIFYLLLKNPTVYQRLMQELEEKRAAGELSDLVTFQQAESCPYLQAVIYEALRLYPAAGLQLNRDVPEGGMKIGKYYVPEGTVVGSSAWVIHRLPEIWGPDFEEFRPERWLEGDVGNLKRFYFSFGGGSRTCVGRSNWLEMSKLVPTLLMRYNIQLAPGAKVTDESGGLIFIKGLNVLLSPRQRAVA
ncbi:cytochrome P450 family protein [Aspergillus costaricaensis CBS 115574]|uniref:Cytochrome P450 family protein n=1 Tax=Aspergillus costaricaensis CBS 115574 TaxID=1448317 RepID=A0ACD1I4E9_9EURO|nr:cytochrome P450 family protein [Aspergillus costaricaensis CBS 115574]RAK85091.1 cytochrome P450 family protein [Aspergillus costaricaensis CBS 115574]